MAMNIDTIQGNRQSSAKMVIKIHIFLLCLLSLNHVYARTTQEQMRDFDVHKKGDSNDTETKCNLFSGIWVHDSSYPQYEASECPYIMKEFNCKGNGRPDSDYQEWRWQPNGCDIPRFSARGFLEKLRGKKITFVGDSITENQFYSLICLVHKEFQTTFVPTSRKNDKFVSTDYNVTFELFWAPFLVQLEIDDDGKRILHVDEIQKNSSHWATADVLMFESSKWWPEQLGSQRWDIVMEGDESYTDMEPLVAYKKALTTWSKWVSSKVDSKTLVFFRGSSFSHYNSQRSCEGEEEPIQDPSYDPQPTAHAAILHQVLSNTEFPVKLFNISRNSAFRIDGHPSKYTNLGKQDCTHWCLPGVPDSWNQLLYTILPSM